MKSVIKITSTQFWLTLLFCLTLILIPTASLAHGNTYSVESRSVFLSGCLLNQSPNFKNDSEIINSISTCVCMLDKFQDHYTDQEFMTLFGQAEQNDPPYVQELNDFTNRHLVSCY